MNNNKQNKMSDMAVDKLMLSMGIPMVISMVLQALYNIVDSAFVSNMQTDGEAALNALTLAFPLQMLMVAVSIGTGVGVNALVSKLLGQANYQKASKAAGNAVFMGFVITVVFILFGIFGVKPYIKSQTENQLICDMAVGYLRICCISSFGIVFFSVYEKLLQAGGNSLYSTIAQISGAVVNIILDPIMIYGLFGCKELGVNGAAYATVIGQIVSFAVAFAFHLKVNENISNCIKNIVPDISVLKEIYSIGLPAIISQALMSFMTYGLNIILGKISESMVTAYGLYYKIQQFLLFAAFGLRDAITPIVSFARGMGDKNRIKRGIVCGVKYTFVIMFLGFAAIEIFAGSFAHVFGLSGETEKLFLSAMRIISISFVFAGTNVALQGVFQALDGGKESLIVSLCRQVVFLFPFVLAFASIAIRYSSKANALVWVAFPICEVLSCIVAIILYKRLMRKISI